MESLLTLLRPSLLPLTRSLPPALQSPLTALLGSACYTALIHDLRPTPTCLTLLLSKTLSLGIILAASIVKVPQILKLVAARSGKGVSLTAYLLETGAYVVALAYNARQGFAFSTYGETALIAVQNGVVVGLVLLYQDSDYSDAAADLVGARKGKGKGKGTTGRGRWMAAGLVGGVAMALWALFDETVVSAELLGRLMAAAGVVGVLSKGPQIWTVWRQGGTGQLSAFAVSEGGANWTEKAERGMGEFVRRLDSSIIMSANNGIRFL